jgi:hypothetical protein
MVLSAYGKISVLFMERDAHSNKSLDNPPPLPCSPSKDPWLFPNQ